MRLVVLGPGHPFRGGIPRATTALVRCLLERGHDVRFLTATRQYPGWLYPGRDDRDPDACPPVPGARRCLDPTGPTSWPAVRRRLMRVGADAWLLPYWTSAWAPLWRSLLWGDLRPPAVAIVHNLRDHDQGALGELGANLVLSRCAGLLTHGENLRRRLERVFPGVPTASAPLPAAGSVEPSPGRAASRSALGLSRDDRVALFLGLIRPYKGVELLIEAAAQLPPEEGWTVIVAGEPWGDLGRRLEEQAARLALGDRLRLLLGWIPEHKVAGLLAAADVVVLPYRDGSQSAVAPLALAAGVPVITTRVGSLPEAVVDGVDGRVIQPGSATAIRDALLGLDGPRLEELRNGVAGRTSASWPEYVRRLESVLGRAIERRGRRTS